jgi:hypothetical protein
LREGFSEYGTFKHRFEGSRVGRRRLEGEQQVLRAWGHRELGALKTLKSLKCVVNTEGALS